MKKYNFLLYRKAILAIIAILLPIALTFYFGYSKIEKYVIKHHLEDLVLLADSSENVVYHFLEMHKRRVEDFASDGFIRDQLEKIVNGHELEVNSLNNHLSKNKKPLDSAIRRISIISLGGKIVATTDFSYIGLDVSAEPSFLKGKAASSITEVGDELAVSTPIKHRITGDIIGVFVSFIPISELSGALSGDFSRRMGAITWGLGRELTTEVYIVNRDKLMLTGSRFIEDAVLKQLVDTEPVTACTQSKHEINGFYKGYRGIEVAGASMCFASMGWTLLVEQDVYGTLEPIKDIKRDALLIGVIVALLISFLFFLFRMFVVLPINKLASGANEISLGNYDVNVSIQSNDEIGLLSKMFNEMAYEIKAKTKAFRDSEKKLIEAQRIGNIGSWEWDLINNKLIWHFEVYRIRGVDLPESDTTPSGFLEYVHPDDRDSVLKAVKRAIEQKENFSVDHRVVHSDGSVKMVHEEAKILLNETGQASRMIGTVQDITERKLAEEELKESHEELHVLALHLQDVREDERKRIARDIHDELGQILSVFNLELMGIKNSLEVDQKSIIENIEEVMALADSAIDSVQRISSDLRPSLLDDLGLIAGIEWHSQDFERRTGIKCNLTVENNGFNLGDKLSTALFRIFQETLTNILRHAEATRVDVSIAITDNNLVLEIGDNGRGISDEDILNPKSFGLLGMRERIYPWDGELHILGTKGEGTKVTLSVPLDTKGEDR